MPGGARTEPTVSVVIPLYNKAAHVARAVRSVLAQTFADLELIVVDDGSTDGGAAAARAAGDPRLRLIRQANAGAGAARNTGIEAARGRWVAFLDADDTWRPERLARQLAALGRADDLVWGAGAYTLGADDRAARVSRPLDAAWFVAPEVVGDALVVLAAGRPVWTGTVMIERRVVHALGGFDAAFRTGQDLELWVRLALRHPRFAYVQSPLAHYRTEVRGSISAQKFKDDSAANFAIARRLLRLAGEVDAPRGALLRRIARRLAVNQAKYQFLAGRADACRASLAALDELDLGPAPGWLRLGSRLPGGAAACRFGLRLRRPARSGL